MASYRVRGDAVQGKWRMSGRQVDLLPQFSRAFKRDDLALSQDEI
jgi:hypothetical protein